MPHNDCCVSCMALIGHHNRLELDSKPVCACAHVRVCVCDSAWVTALCRRIRGKGPNTQSALCIKCSRLITCQLGIKWLMSWLMLHAQAMRVHTNTHIHTGTQPICSYFFPLRCSFVQPNLWSRMRFWVILLQPCISPLSAEHELLISQHCRLWHAL